ncbi:hypothetical protein A2154_02655 [Candidatus Gottesmanbacteria bacterium RBG_16_43_7]|uniref:Uncharacterized protein n=1 Tax=Candidatus Gottesmanbacteria bacterium RBG_16_43_7 TaxID=1798373 RepID=A0A1F5Z9D2_9BACT|nr:MAG: hypothetical protein A2154_02655 [Candidatus Gottesmanbacteria bacterium RBG_16_43_7]
MYVISLNPRTPQLIRSLTKLTADDNQVSYIGTFLTEDGVEFTAEFTLIQEGSGGKLIITSPNRQLLKQSITILTTELRARSAPAESRPPSKRKKKHYRH